MPEQEIKEDIWKGDLLSRKDDGIYLQRFIENAYKMDSAHQNSFVLNVNSEWGSGKTWFLERFAKQLKENHPVVYFDAWKNDFTKDPLMSLIAVICQSLDEQFSGDLKIKRKVASVKKTALKFIKPSLPVVLAALVKHYTGLPILESDDTEISEGAVLNTQNSSIQETAASLAKIAASEAMNNFYTQKKGIEEFIAAVKAFVEHLRSNNTDSHLPICIFIDELDRCRPTYAIELLEAVKHIFSIGGLFFVIATDSKQLAHSIKAVYGQSFNSTAYLKRFFYTEYSLSNVDYDRMAKHLIAGFDFQDRLFLPSAVVKDGLDGYFSKNSQFFQLTPREQEQIFINLKNCVLSSDLDCVHFSYLLFLLSLKLKHEDVYEEMMKSKDSKIFSEFMKEKNAKGSIYAFVVPGDSVYRQKSDPEKIEIADLVNFYDRHRDGDFKKMKIEDCTYLYQEEIIRVMQKELVPDSYGRPTNIHSIATYFSLITQAGRLIKNV